MLKYFFQLLLRKIVAEYKFLIFFDGVNNTNKEALTRNVISLGNKYKRDNILIKKLADNVYIAVFLIKEANKQIINSIIGKLCDDFSKIYSGNILVCEIGELLSKKPFS